MRERHLVGLRLRRKVRTTVPDPDATPVPDLLKRDFTAPAPDIKYVGDITYLPYDGGHLYLATVIDCHSRRLVGWSIADHMRTDLVADALRAASATRGNLAGVVFHSDHAAQCGAKDYAKLCRELGVTRSMGAVGTSADNALAESFNAALKRETLQGAARWDTAQLARLAVFTWISRYNTRRRHSYSGHLSPNTYENISTSVTLRPAAQPSNRVSRIKGQGPTWTTDRPWCLPSCCGPSPSWASSSPTPSPASPLGAGRSSDCSGPSGSSSSSSSGSPAPWRPSPTSPS